jgi:hypothetical protein
LKYAALQGVLGMIGRGWQADIYLGRDLTMECKSTLIPAPVAISVGVIATYAPGTLKIFSFVFRIIKLLRMIF